jgi:hypothetical protein
LKLRRATKMQAQFRAVVSVSAAGGPFVKSNHCSGAGGGFRCSRLIQAGSVGLQISLDSWARLLSPFSSIAQLQEPSSALAHTFAPHSRTLSSKPMRTKSTSNLLVLVQFRILHLMREPAADVNQM